MSTEVAGRAAFDRIRYAQVWEDGDVLLRALAIEPGDRCLSICSAGDNALAMLTAHPAKVVAVDLNAAQIACLELRVAGLKNLSREEMLRFLGSQAATPAERQAFYARCREALSKEARRFWDDQPRALREGFGAAGKFERYFALFRKLFLPLVHGRGKVRRLLAGGDFEARERFYEEEWNTLRWRLLFRLFFSREVMGVLGRSPAFFRYVEGSVADRILSRTRHALVHLDPRDNPWLHWILTGHHGGSLPAWLTEENWDKIKNNLDRLEWRLASVEEALGEAERFQRLNLSDIFEYMSEKNSTQLLEKLCKHMPSGGRLVYWNMLAPRSRPEHLADRLEPLNDLATRLHLEDRAFFYSRLVIEKRV